MLPPPVFNLRHCALTHSDVLLQWVIAVIVISKELLFVIVLLLLFLVRFLDETFAYIIFRSQRSVEVGYSPETI